MKRVFYIAISIIACSLIFTSCLTSKVEQKSTSKAFKTLSFKEDLDYLITDISYPEFDNYPELSKKIKNTIFSNWESFKSYSKNDWQQLNDINARESKSSLPAYEYIVKTQVDTSSYKYISILINTYVYNGGAHGNTSLISYNFNCESSKYDNILTVTGLDYNKISEISRKQLYEKIITNNENITSPSQEDDLKEMINMGAFPQAGNYEIFTVGKKLIKIYFEPYSVAPYAYGIQTVDLKIE
ncbi:MAG: DUF3298 and DUF4163 domain-containing protein [Treponema sp.]|nr:DUF3298 and DUF4163 domain-containing protein [Treponema sp.]